MRSTNCLVISGPLPSAVMRMFRDRFEAVRVWAERAGLVIQCPIPDQAAMRGPLTQIWDAGGAVPQVAVMSTSDPRSQHVHDQR